MTTLKNAKKIQLLSHNDLDGVSPAILLENAFPNAEIHSSFYGNDDIDKGIIDFLKANKDTDVVIFVTDITITKDTALHLEDRHRNGQLVFYFDHHKPSKVLEEDFTWVKVTPMSDGERKTCATEMLFQFLISEGLLKDDSILTDFVETVRLFDTWDWATSGSVIPAQINDLYYMVGYQNFKNLINEMLLEYDGKIRYTDKINTLIEAEDYRKNKYLKDKEDTIIRHTILGYKVGIIFAENYHSELGNYLAIKNEDLDLITIVNMSKNKLSFRTIKDNVDLSEFAKNFNGGGHQKAAGGTLLPEFYPTFVYPHLS